MIDNLHYSTNVDICFQWICREIRSFRVRWQMTLCLWSTVHANKVRWWWTDVHWCLLILSNKSSTIRRHEHSINRFSFLRRPPFLHTCTDWLDEGMRFVTLCALPSSPYAFALPDEYTFQIVVLLSRQKIPFSFLFFFVRIEEKRSEREGEREAEIRCIYKRNVKWMIDILQSLWYKKEFRELHLIFSSLEIASMSANNPNIDSMKKFYDHVWHWIVKQTYESKFETKSVLHSFRYLTSIWWCKTCWASALYVVNHTFEYHISLIHAWWTYSSA